MKKMYIDIKSILDEKNISRYQLAQEIDVTYPTITAIYNGTSTSIKFDTLEKICNALGCKPNDILKFENSSSELSTKTTANNSYMNLPS
jgi:putative transcriptional regulator